MHFSMRKGDDDAHVLLHMLCDHDKTHEVVAVLLGFMTRSRRRLFLKSGEYRGLLYFEQNVELKACVVCITRQR